MKNTITVLIFIATIFVTLLASGCVQSSPAPAGINAGIQASPSATAPVGQHQGLPQNAGTAQAGSQRQYQGQGQGQRPSPNATVLAGAAVKLGIPEPQLESALTNPSGGRVNFTDAAQQLGVTPQQLADALGMTGEGQGLRNGTGPRATPGGQ
jgi:hypothetical protein